MVVLALGACGEVRPSGEAPSTAIAPSPQPTLTPVPPGLAAALPTATPAVGSLPTRTPVVVAAAQRVPTATPAPTETPTQATRPTPTTVPQATATPSPAPTGTPVPTATPPQPTSIGAPAPADLSPAPTPTETPEPTATPLQPTPTPTPPLVLNGETADAEEVLQTEADEVLTTVEVVKILRPSVVHIATQALTTGMFNQPIPLEGVGTGIILDLEGHILTNNHVVEGAQNIIVTLNTDESFAAVVVGVDPRTDTAVIRIEAEGLQPAKLGDSSALEVGEDVIAIGHALGLAGGPTVSKGVVSALGRSIETDPGSRIVIVDLIQTDASINPGNSGGPLVNDRAEVVGINTAVIQESQGIGFAININDAAVVAEQIIANGFVQRGLLGIRPDNVTPSIAAQAGFPVNEGVWVESVTEGGAAEAAGLLPGDIIVQLGDDPIANTGELAKFLLAHPPGETVAVVFFRGSESITGEITLGEPATS